MKLADDEIKSILAKGGLIIDQPYNVNGKYRKDGYIFTLCAQCGTEAHYRLQYILNKNEIGEPYVAHVTGGRGTTMPVNSIACQFSR